MTEENKNKIWIFQHALEYIEILFSIYTEEENILQFLFCLIYSYVCIRCNTVLIRTIC